MRKLLAIIFILIQFVLVVAPNVAQAASVENFATGTLFGSVWLDTNENNIQELSERPRSNVTVELKNANGELVQSTTTDETGNYFFTELEYGEYIVWANTAGNVMTQAGTVEIAEVNGSVSLDIPQTLAAPASDGMILTPAPNVVFLPFINS